MPPDVHLRLRGRGEDPQFAARSQQARINRGVDLERGVAPPTHCHGRRNAMQFIDDMVNFQSYKLFAFIISDLTCFSFVINSWYLIFLKYKERNDEETFPTAIDLFQSAKSKGKLPRRAELADKKKAGKGKTATRENVPNPSFLSQKDKGIYVCHLTSISYFTSFLIEFVIIELCYNNLPSFQDEYVRRANEFSTQDAEYDPNELYYELVGGTNKKGRVYGMGKAIKHFFGGKSEKTKGGKTESSTPYTPGIIPSLQAENRELKKAVAQFEEWKKEMEARFDGLVGDPPPHCRLETDHNRRFDDFDPFTGGGTAGIC
jgi:hypothetical protein